MLDRFEDLRTFVAVVENQSFARAANRLGIVKSAVSRRVRDLEERLGVRLINRTTRQVGLTAAGALLYERCLELLSALEQAEEAVSAAAASLTGAIRVSAPMSFGIHCVAPAVADFLDRNAAVSIELFLDDRIVDIVGEGFDLALRIANLPDSTLIARRIGPVSHALCASPAYLARHGTPASPDDLRHHRGIAYSNVKPTAYWRLRDPVSGRDIDVQVQCPLQCNNGDAIREAAIAGFGIAALPTFIVHDAVKRGELHVLLADHRRMPVPLHAVLPPGRHIPRRVRALVDFLVQRFGPLPDWDKDVYGPNVEI